MLVAPATQECPHAAGCISFLFAALAELAVVSYMMRSDRPHAAMYFSAMANPAHAAIIRNTNTKLGITPFTFF